MGLFKNKIQGLEDIFIACVDGLTGFPSDDAAQKQIFLAICNISKKWTMPIRNWDSAINRF